MTTLTPDIEPLDPGRHADLGLREDLDFAFARAHSVAPLTFAEIVAASVWYPVVFTEDDPRPVAVMGVQPGPNLYVTAEGTWRRNAYVPAAIRRHPFLLQEEPDGTLRLCVKSPRQVLAHGGRPLFADGQPTGLYKGAFEFCASLIAEEAQTARFMEALKARKLLAPRTANLRARDGGTVQQAFLTIDERALRDLAAEDFIELRRQGWLSTIFAQLNSTLNWHKIGDLHAGAEAGPAAQRSAVLA